MDLLVVSRVPLAFARRTIRRGRVAPDLALGRARRGGRAGDRAPALEHRRSGCGGRIALEPRELTLRHGAGLRLGSNGGAHGRPAGV